MQLLHQQLQLNLQEQLYMQPRRFCRLLSEVIVEAHWGTS